ncbi:phage major capsid protein [Micromonospora sp. WMMD558]|uniref:phage major capsid protein n=1 Tax=Micromonospora sp. WMMD558 TaxID=3403462 RepID=UPI003BF5C9CF
MKWRGLLRLGRADTPPARMTPHRPAARFSVEVPPEMLQAMTGGGAIAPRISRDEALQVPAVLRARNIICGALSTLPIRVHSPDRRLVTDVTYLPSGNIDPNIANSAVKAQIYEDLFFESISWLKVTRFGWHGYPVEARHVPVGSVHVAPAGGLMPAQISPDQPFPVDGQVYIDGMPVRDDEIIRFDSPNPPLLRHAARAIRTCLLLERTVATYAKDPLPLGYFAPKGDIEPPTPEQVEEILDDWEEARRDRSWGYVNGALEAKTLQWSPEQLQLAAARQHAVLEIARATGLDAEDLQVSVTSRTYANQEQRWQALINTSLGPYVTAVQERLSMRDVLPRGYEARIDFGAFLRGDTKTRMETYKVGREVGAYDDERIADLEDIPVASVRNASKPQTPPAAPATAPESTPPGTQQERREDRVPREIVNFDAGESVQLQFEAPDPQDFQVDPERRTITGLLLPWGKVANNGMGKWRFTKDSVSWSEVSRIKLNQHHDSRDLIGVATRLQSASRGLVGTFKVGRGPEGDRALEKAEDGILDGFSVEVDFNDFDSWQPDPTDESVRLVRQANLRGVALTGTPAFDDARLTSVKASRNQKGTHMPTNQGTGQPDAANFDFDGYMSGLADKITESHKSLTTSLSESIGESVSAGVKAALENISAPQDGPQPVRAARYTVTREAPIYSFDGAGNSLVRDAWYAGQEHDDDAVDRLRKFRAQTEEVAKLARSALRFHQSPGLPQQFATVTTGTASQVIPPGYRPDLFVPMLQQGRPMVNALSQGVISNATPFVVPVFGSATGATADHAEGVNPTDGSLTFTTKTVTPGAISGKLILTREIVDSSNPAIDQIALQAMNESYARQTEAKVYTLLNGANGAGGTITTGLVPSGAQAATFASTGGTPYAEAALIKGIRAQLAAYPFKRFGAPGIALMGQNATSIMATVTDSTGRPLFPSIGATNAAGLGNAITQGWSVDGMPFVPAWAMTGVAAGDSQILMLNPSDAWVWASPTLTFKFEEKSGPALIELALFGYFATHLLRPVGLSGIRITP